MARYLVLGAALLAVAHGASLATTAKRNCSLKAIACDLQVDIAIEQFSEFDYTIEETRMLIQSCDVLVENCLNTVECISKNETMLEKSRNIKSFCQALVFLVGDYQVCVQKMAKKDSQCFREWRPDWKDLPEKTCQNSFGEDNCLKELMKESCGEQVWITSRDLILLIHPDKKQCDF